MHSSEQPTDIPLNFNESWNHDIIEQRFATSAESSEMYPVGGAWQILYETELILRQCNQQNIRQIAFPVGEVGSFDHENYTWESNGISCTTVQYEAIANGLYYLQITTTNNNNFDLFTDLTVNLLRQGVSSAFDVLQRLRLLQSWWGNPSPPMSEQIATGLFGELYFLARHLNEPWGERVGAWDGPTKSLKDFNWANHNQHVEVKTTQSSQDPLEHTISSLQQLFVEEGHTLLLFSLSARIDPGGGESLNGIINEITEGLGSDMGGILEFNDKLAACGWSPTSSEFRFVVTQPLARLYEVREGFPRILHTDSDYGIDPRISVQTYRVSFQGLELFELQNTSGSREELFSQTMP